MILSYLDDVIDDNGEFDEATLRENEKKYLGFNLKYDISNKIDELVYKYKTIPLDKLVENNYCNSVVIINKIRELKTKNGDNMLSLVISDGKLDISAIIFPKFYNQLRNMVELNKILIARGRLERDKKNYLSFNIVDIKNV